MQQIEAVRKGDPVRILLPEAGQDVVLLSSDTYEAIRELLWEERQRRRIAAVAMQNALGRINSGFVLEAACEPA